MELNEISVVNPLNVNMSQELLNINNLQIIEEGPQVSQDLNLKNLPILEEGSQVSRDLNTGDLRIVEEGPQICPLCYQETRWYFINYTEKIEMCGNIECDYPFAYESVKILREENRVQTVEVKSTDKRTRSEACSQPSSQGWSDVDRVCNVFEGDDAPSVDIGKLKTLPSLKKIESDRRKEELLENVEKIKQMTKSMSDMRNESKRIIENEKWIKNLQYLQGLSGFNLLKPAEMKKIKKKAGSPGSSELKIDMDKNNLANIKIEVNRTSASNTKLV